MYTFCAFLVFKVTFSYSHTAQLFALIFFLYNVIGMDEAAKKSAS